MNTAEHAQHTFTSQDAEAVIELVKFAYTFCDVKRATFLPDGKTPESDGTHTVVLSVLGTALAKRFYPHLDSGLISQFILVHDLVEAYAGDTSTFNISAMERKTKEERETVALNKIEANFGSSFPEIVELIHAYERLDTPEARFVKMLDKLMPTLSHILNKGATLHQNGVNEDGFEQLIDKGTAHYLSTEFGQENCGLMSLRSELLPLLKRSAYSTE